MNQLREGKGENKNSTKKSISKSNIVDELTSAAYLNNHFPRWSITLPSRGVYVMPWTPRDLEIVEALAAKVSLLTRGQVARGWWGPGRGCEGHARGRLRRLARSGLLRTYRVNAHPVSELKGPVVRWNPGNPDPDAEAVSARLRARWTEPSSPTTVYTASPKAASLLGCSGGELPELTHRDHDLLLGEVFVTYLRDDPEAARRWVGEAARPKAGYRVKDPDAFLLDREGNTLRVVESGGKYDPERVEAFHEHCAELRLPYELW